MNKVIKIIFIEMLTLEGRLEGDEEVSHVIWLKEELFCSRQKEQSEQTPYNGSMPGMFGE